MIRGRRLRARTLSAAAAVAVAIAAAPAVAAAQVANVTVGVVAVDGSASMSSALASPLANPLLPGCYGDFVWTVSAQGVAGGAAAVVDLGGNAYPPSGISFHLSVQTCQSWWIGGYPLDVLQQPSVITGSIDGTSVNGSTLSCSIAGTNFNYVAGYVSVGASGGCRVDGSAISVHVLYEGAFLPVWDASSSATSAVVAGALLLSPV